MQRILILGGGVGGTLTANLLVKKLRARIDRGEVAGPGRRRDRPARLPARVHVHRHGRRASREPPAPGALAARQAGRPRRRRGRAGRCRAPGRDPHRRPAARLRPARAGDRARGSSPRRSSTSTRRPSTSTRPRPPLACATRSTRSRAAGSSSASPACPTSARRRRSRSPSSSSPSCASAACASAPTIDFCSPIGRAFTIESVSEMATPILAAEGHRAAHVLQRRGDRPRAQGRPEPRGRGAPVRPAHPRAAAQGPAVPDGLRPGAGAGRLAADRPGDAPGRRPAERLRPRRRHRPAALEGRLDRPLRGAGRHRADRRGDRGPRASTTSTATTSARSCASSRSATARARSSSSTTTHPPRPPKPNQLWHLGKIVFNKTYWHTVPKGRV